MPLVLLEIYRRKKAVQSFLVQLRTIFAEICALFCSRAETIRYVERTHIKKWSSARLSSASRQCQEDAYSPRNKRIPGIWRPLIASRRTRPHLPCHAAATGLCTGPSRRSVSDVFRALMVADTIPRRDYVRRHVERGHAARAKHTSWVVCCHASEAPAALSCGYAGLYPGEKQRR